jgi:hypothetical protein
LVWVFGAPNQAARFRVILEIRTAAETPGNIIVAETIPIIDAVSRLAIWNVPPMNAVSKIIIPAPRMRAASPFSRVIASPFLSRAYSSAHRIAAATMEIAMTIAAIKLNTLSSLVAVILPQNLNISMFKIQRFFI